MRKNAKDILAHGAIILSFMMIVLLIADLYNDAMAFINNNITKTLLVILSIISILNGIYIIALHRRRS